VELLDIHPHALVHGLTEEDVRHAWRNAFSWARRDRDDGKIDYMLIGVDGRGRLVELLARRCGKDSYVVFHAMTPPTKKALAEVGLDEQ
jgi:hypothetical protein